MGRRVEHSFVDGGMCPACGCILHHDGKQVWCEARCGYERQCEDWLCLATNTERGAYAQATICKDCD